MRLVLLEAVKKKVNIISILEMHKYGANRSKHQNVFFLFGALHILILICNNTQHNKNVFTLLTYLNLLNLIRRRIKVNNFYINTAMNFFVNPLKIVWSRW